MNETIADRILRLAADAPPISQRQEDVLVSILANAPAAAAA